MITLPYPKITAPLLILLVYITLRSLLNYLLCKLCFSTLVPLAMVLYIDCKVKISFLYTL